MKNKDITVTIQELAYDELTPEQAALVEAARQATYRSYAPYSNFKVGAAIRMANGETVPGSNQENAAFSSGTCAERSVCFYAASRYPDTNFEAIAIAARGEDDDFITEPIPPCGACRQALMEYENKQQAPLPLLLAGRDKVYAVSSVRDLMPLAFTEF